jgi:hypothetical protein
MYADQLLSINLYFHGLGTITSHNHKFIIRSDGMHSNYWFGTYIGKFELFQFSRPHRRFFHAETPNSSGRLQNTFHIAVRLF